MDASELEAALRALLVPYKDVLELSEIYGIQVLHRRGARAHDWFAGVRPGKGTAKLMLLPIKGHPELLDDASPALLKRRSGDALFTLRPGDEALLPEVSRLVARAFDAYAKNRRVTDLPHRSSGRASSSGRRSSGSRTAGA
jgi:hypothetical protein